MATALARPANLANKYASVAEDFVEQENWRRAIENYYLAAEQYLLAVKETADAEDKQTLKLLYTTNVNKARDLQKRAGTTTATVTTSKPTRNGTQAAVPLTELAPTNNSNAQLLESAGGAKQQQQASSLPPLTQPQQIPPVAQMSFASPATSSTASSSSSTSTSFTASSPVVVVTTSSAPRPITSAPIVVPSASARAPQSVIRVAPASAAVAQALPSSPSSRVSLSPPLSSSPPNPISGSKAPQQGDVPMTRFWDTVEALVARLPNIAAPTLHLPNLPNLPNLANLPNLPNWTLPGQHPQQETQEYSASSSVDSQDALNSSMLKSYYVVPSAAPSRPSRQHNDGTDGESSLAGSTFTSILNQPIGLKENGIGEEPPVTSSGLMQENAALREIIAAFERNRNVLEDIAKENNLLRSNIVQFRNEFQDQARRYRQEQSMMLTSTPMSRNPSGAATSQLQSNLQSSMPNVHKSSTTVSSGSSTPNPMQQQQQHEVSALKERLRLLEAENTNLHAENKSLSARLKKYKDRWDELAEGARRRRTSVSDPASGSTATAPSGSPTNKMSSSDVLENVTPAVTLPATAKSTHVTTSTTTVASALYYSMAE